MESRFRRFFRSQLAYLPVLFVLLGVGAAVVVTNRRATTVANEWQPAFGQSGKIETVLAVISSSTCPAGSEPGFADAIRAIRIGLRDRARGAGHTFSSIGVALDWNPQEGFNYLSKLAPFDELMAGRSWINAGALKFFWSETLGGSATTPQIVVYDRVIRNLGNGQYELVSERQRFRKAGAREIIQWAQMTFPSNMPRK